VGAQDVLHVLYAQLYCPTYRVRYGDFLKKDFPRVFLTRDLVLFRGLCELGGDLVALHLLEDDYPAASWNRSAAGPSPLRNPGSMIAGKGKTEVARGYPQYYPGSGKVFVNPSRWFEGVGEEVWDYHIGGYQVCRKWLKDRRGRTLSAEDIRHFRRVVAALHETIRLTGAIDQAIAEHGGWAAAFTV
jgi:predicted helicase